MAVNDITGDQLRSRVSTNAYRLGYLRVFEKENFKKQVRVFFGEKDPHLDLTNSSDEEVEALFDEYMKNKED